MTPRPTANPPIVADKLLPLNSLLLVEFTVNAPELISESLICATLVFLAELAIAEPFTAVAEPAPAASTSKVLNSFEASTFVSPLDLIVEFSIEAVLVVLFSFAITSALPAAPRPDTETAAARVAASLSFSAFTVTVSAFWISEYLIFAEIVFCI